MTDKILRADDIALHRAVNQISDGEFRLLMHLIVYADDWGRQVADPVVIKGTAMPRSERATPEKIARWLDGLAAAGLLVTYTVDGEEYLQLTLWNQRKRAGDSRFPGPDDPHAATCRNLPQLAATCRNLPQQEKTPPDPRKRSDVIPDISEINSWDTGDTATPIPSSPYNPPAPLPPPAFELPLNDGTIWPVTEEQLDEYRGLYPAVDVEQEFRSMIGWLRASPANRKTRTGIRRFIANWLSREQNRAPARQAQRKSPLDVIRAEREAST